jgi:predicted ribosomally synthesized peptide with SipW-like signal peptide
MRRSILTSLVVIGAAMALVVGAGTFAVFTDTENIEGTANSAIVDFELTGDTIGGNSTGVNEAANEDTLTVSFDGDGFDCGFDVFAPGDTCTIPVQLTRDAATIADQLAVDLDITALSAGGQSAVGVPGNSATVSVDCDGAGTGGWVITATLRDAGSVNPDRMPAGTADGDQFIDVKAELLSATGDDCQDNTLSDISVTIVATQAGAADVHSNTYD